MKQSISIIAIVYLFLISSSNLIGMHDSDLEEIALQEIAKELHVSDNPEEVLNKYNINDLDSLEKLKKLLFFKKDKILANGGGGDGVQPDYHRIKDSYSFGNGKYSIKVNKNNDILLYNKVLKKNYELKGHNSLVLIWVFPEIGILISKDDEKLLVWNLNGKPYILTKIETTQRIAILQASKNNSKNIIEILLKIDDTPYLVNLNLLSKINEKIKGKELEAILEQKKYAQNIELIARLFQKGFQTN